MTKFSKFVWISASTAAITVGTWQMAYYRREGGPRLIGDGAYLVTADIERVGGWEEDDWWGIPLTNVAAFVAWMDEPRTNRVVGASPDSMRGDAGYTYLGFVATNAEKTIWMPRAAHSLLGQSWMNSGVWEHGNAVKPPI